MTSIYGVPVDAAYHLVFALTTVLTPVLGGLAAVAGIVLITLAVRLLVLPLSFRAMRGQAIAARLAPELQKLRTRYGKQPERLQREMSALYKREGTSMFASVSPMLLQWPLLSVMYLLFRSAQVGGGPNRLLTSDLFGVPLGSYWLHGTWLTGGRGLVFVGVFAVLAALCWLLARIGRSLMPAAPAASGAPGAGLSLLLGKVLPYLTVVIAPVVMAAVAPLAAAVYLVTSTGWSVLERYLFLARTGPSRPQHQPAVSAGRRSLPDGPAKRVSP
jgi:YidC/Oxa1 family membrane protein insertase